ncbi:MAG: ECF transporter S component, partial [Zestosphaera sp.]
MSVVRVSLYTALVLIATIVLQVYTPATRGYFNLGEVAIYTVAALTSPLIAGVAGGVGSALADLVTGYGIFAPGTLVIKFVEGFIASSLISSFR